MEVAATALHRKKEYIEDVYVSAIVIFATQENCIDYYYYLWCCTVHTCVNHLFTFINSLCFAWIYAEWRFHWPIGRAVQSLFHKHTHKTLWSNHLIGRSHLIMPTLHCFTCAWTHLLRLKTHILTWYFLPDDARARLRQTQTKKKTGYCANIKISRSDAIFFSLPNWKKTSKQYNSQTHTQTDSIFNPSYEIEPRKALDSSKIIIY